MLVTLSHVGDLEGVSANDASFYNPLLILLSRVDGFRDHRHCDCHCCHSCRVRLVFTKVNTCKIGHGLIACERALLSWLLLKVKLLLSCLLVTDSGDI